MTERRGSSFEYPDVVSCYVHRPPYPPEIFERILALSPRRGALLDLGCRPGKIARELAGEFEWITAVDPSAAMLAVARESLNGRSPNIRWIHSLAEDADYGEQRFDVVVARVRG